MNSAAVAERKRQLLDVRELVDQGVMSKEAGDIAQANIYAEFGYSSAGAIPLFYILSFYVFLRRCASPALRIYCNFVNG